MAKQHAVDLVRDDPVRLRERLDEIVQEKGEVISIMWQPARDVPAEPDAQAQRHKAGYVVVSVYEFPDADRT